MLPRSSKAARVSRRFTAYLDEPAEEVRVAGDSFFVHRTVLREIPFFAAKRAGKWCDSARAEVELPCSAGEFGLLIQRLYTGEPLGSPALPVESFSSALRLAQAAAMLLIDDCLPELPSLLRSSAATAEDTAAASEAAAGSLPVGLREALQDAAAHPLSGELLVQVLLKAKAGQVQDAVSAALGMRDGQNCADAVAKAATQLMSQRDDAAVRWGARLVLERLDFQRATCAFMSSQLRCACGSRQPQFGSMELCKAFWTHVHRCAAHGVATEAVALGAPRKSECICPRCHSHYPVNALEMNRTHRSALAAVARAMSRFPHGIAALAQVLAQFPADQLAEVVSIELLDHLPLLPRRQVCEQLVHAFGHIGEDVAVAVVKVLV